METKAALLALSLTATLAGGCSMANTDLPISKDLQNTILEDAAKRTSIPKAHIDLRMLTDWDNAKCPIVEAMPQAHGANPRRYAVIGNELLAANKAENFGKILKACFADVSKANALDLARLSTMFGHFGSPVGMVWARDLSVDHPEIATPTKEFKPVLKDVDGKKVLEFYTFSSPLDQFYFCRVLFSGDAPELTATLLNNQ